MKFIESTLNEEATHNDYPAAAKKNAQMAIDWKEEHGRDEVEAGTPVGWARAHQLAKGENLSTDTVKRMSAFNRHRKNSSIKPELKETPWKDRGYVAWLIWGGDEGVDWAIEKSKEIDAMKESNQLRYIKPINEAENYITDKFKVGDKIKTGFGEWEVIETDYAPKKRFTSPFIFKGDDMKRLDLKAPPTNKQAVGYKVTDGDKYPIIGFLYQYKDITKLATVGVDESVNELKRTLVSGTMSGSTESLEDRKYELKKDAKGATIGNFSNVTLPKGTIIYNLPGGVFADHFSLKNKYASRSSQGPQYFDKPTFKGIMIKQTPAVLSYIEKNSKVLESLTEGTYNSKDHIGDTSDGQGSNAEIYKKGKGYYVVVSGEFDYDFTAKNDKELLQKLKDNEFDNTDILESMTLGFSSQDFRRNSLNTKKERES